MCTSCTCSLQGSAAVETLDTQIRTILTKTRELGTAAAAGCTIPMHNKVRRNLFKLHCLMHEAHNMPLNWLCYPFPVSRTPHSRRPHPLLSNQRCQSNSTFCIADTGPVASVPVHTSCQVFSPVDFCEFYASVPLLFPLHRCLLLIRLNGEPLILRFFLIDNWFWSWNILRMAVVRMEISKNQIATV